MPDQELPARSPPEVIGNSLPDYLFERGRERLGRLSLAIALVFALSAAMWIIAAFRTPGRTEMVWYPAACVGLSLLAYGMTRWRQLTPRQVCDLGLVYEIALGAVIALSRLQGDLDPASAYALGISPITVGIVLFPLIVPNTRLKTVGASLIAASADPIALSFHIGLTDSVFSLGPFVAHAFPNFLCVLLAILVHRTVVRTGRDAAIGELLGRYHLVHKLGEGGMGEVWKAEHVILAMPVAIKLIRFDRQSDELAELFEREARATAALNSPHVVRVYDYGTTDDGRFYYAMELLNGLNLHRAVRKFGPMPPERVAHILHQICLALAEAHPAGLVHRDIKPANVMICRAGAKCDFVRLLDFGLVQIQAEDQPDQERRVLGTLGFVGPEVLRPSHAVGPSADIYSLGCLAYWLLTGKKAFDQDTAATMLEAQMAGDLEPPSARTSQPVSAEIDQLVMQCLHTDPRERPASADELLTTLEGLVFEERWTRARRVAWWDARIPDGPVASLQEDPAAETIMSFTVPNRRRRTSSRSFKSFPTE